MAKFLEPCNFSILNQEEIHSLNGVVTSSKTELVIKKKTPSKQKPRTDQPHGGILSNIQRSTNTHPSQTIPKN